MLPSLELLEPEDDYEPWSRPLESASDGGWSCGEMNQYFPASWRCVPPDAFSESIANQTIRDFSHSFTVLGTRELPSNFWKIVYSVNLGVNATQQKHGEVLKSLHRVELSRFEDVTLAHRQYF
jgi:hypothetical protein